MIRRPTSMDLLRKRSPMRSQQEGILRLNQLNGHGARQSVVGGGFTVDGVNFSGTQYLSRGALGADSKTGIMSFWLKPTFGAVNDGGLITGWNGGAKSHSMILEKPVLGLTRPRLDSHGSSVLYMASNLDCVTVDWSHFLFSWDTSTAVLQIYMDGQDALLGGGSSSNANIEYSTFNNWWFGGDSGSWGSPFVSADIAEFYFAPGQYLDFTNSANRLKFRTSLGIPENLGTTGSTPTGSAPLFYMHLSDGEAPANWGLNRSGAGDWTVNGTLTTSTTSPTDAPIAEVQFNNFQGGNTNAGTTLTQAFTCSGVDRALIVCASTRSSSSVTGVTYNGVAMTSLGAAVTNGSVTSTIWALSNPASGSNNIVVTVSSSNSIMYSGYSFTNAHQTTSSLTGTRATATGTSTDPSVAVSSAVGEQVVGFAAYPNNPFIIPTLGAGQRKPKWNSEGNAAQYSHVAFIEYGATSVTISLALSASVAWGIQGVSVKPP